MIIARDSRELSFGHVHDPEDRFGGNGGKHSEYEKYIQQSEAPRKGVGHSFITSLGGTGSSLPCAFFRSDGCVL
jgi:hypothetical protein